MPFTPTLPRFLHEQSAVAPAEDTQPNSIARLTERARAGTLTWTWPLVMCFIRLPLLLGCFVVSLLIARVLGHPDAAGFAEGLTRFDLPVVADVICLALLWRLTRAEGLRLRDLFCWSRKRLLRDLALGVGVFLLAYILLFAIEALIAILAVSRSGAQQAQAMQALLASGAINPLGMGWQIGMNALIVPLSAAFTEELVYRGYALARLTALSEGRGGGRWLPVGIMTLGFAAQHLAYGLTSWQGALSVVVGAAVAGALFGALYYLTRQRLAALIFIHWQSDLISLGLAPILLALFIR